MLPNQTADVAIPIHEKTQWQFSGLGNSDPSRRGDTAAQNFGPRENTPVPIENRIHSVARPVNREGLA